MKKSMIIGVLTLLATITHSELIITNQINPGISIGDNPPSLDEIIISEGEKFSWSFNPSQFSKTGNWDPATQMYAPYIISVDKVETESDIKISLFENPDSSIPFEESTIHIAVTQNRLLVAPFSLDPEFVWTDKSGRIEIESIQGDFKFFNLTSHTVVNGEYLTASIPEPSSTALILVGIGSLYLRRKRFPTRTWSLR